MCVSFWGKRTDSWGNMLIFTRHKNPYIVSKRDHKIYAQCHIGASPSLKTVLKDAMILSKQADYDGLRGSEARNGLEQPLLNLLGQALPDKDKLLSGSRKNSIKSRKTYSAFYTTPRPP